MISILSKLGLDFLSSKFVTVLLLIAIAGATWWLTAKIKQAELTEQANKTLIQTIDQQKNQITVLSEAVQRVTQHAATITSFDNQRQQQQAEVAKLVQSNEDETLNSDLPNQLINSMCDSGQFTLAASAKYCRERVDTMPGAKSNRR